MTPKEITVFTDFKWKDYEGVEEKDISFPSFTSLVRKEFTRLYAEIEALKKIIGVEK